MKEKIVFTCLNCKQKLRVPVVSHKTLKVTCPICATEIDFNCDKYISKQKLIKMVNLMLIISFFVLYVALPISFKLKMNSTVVALTQNCENEKNELQKKYFNDISILKEQHQREVEKIDLAKLMFLSKQHYENELQERKRYDSRYAITPREKVQLELLALANDKTKTIEGMVEKVAEKAAPRKSEVIAYTTLNGIVIDINFDMSELTSGEKGTRTKHSTIESLKKEVVRLISQVTNDVYEFCKDIDIESILIGCKHHVNQENEFGQTRDEDAILYKVRLNKKDIKNLEHNPFLDTYTTTSYFKVEINEFPNITITQEYIQ